ncbi:unnamed protein product [Parajaminaea phylloscopi]
MSVESSPLTYNETVDGLVQFVECSIHTILHLRRVYPPEVFRLHRLYQVPVYRSRHPGLNEYLDGIVKSLRAEVAAQRAQRLILVISSATTLQPLERYIFDFEYLIPAAASQADRNLAIRNNVGLRDMQLGFRGFLLKLTVLDAGLEGVHDEEDLTFAVLLQAQSAKHLHGAEPPKPTPGPGAADPHLPDEDFWVPADARGPDRLLALHSPEASSSVHDASSHVHHERSDPVLNRSARPHSSPAVNPRTNTSAASYAGSASPVILPVRNLDTGVINLMLYVEDNTHVKATLRDTVAKQHGRSVVSPSSSEGHHQQHTAAKTSKRQSDETRNGHRRPPRPAHAHARADSVTSEDDGVAAQSGNDSDSLSERSSQASAVSVGDFAGYGGAGAGRGGGGMAAAW